MIRWIVRCLIIFTASTAGWFQISQDLKGILIGAACASLIILAEIFIELLDKNILSTSLKTLILDSSALIDGRISDIYELKFLTGKILVPRFVLKELHALSDSTDPIKRQRGRRGLEVLAQLQKIQKGSITILEKDFPASKDTETKLVELAKNLNGRIVTTDFNLNKSASLGEVEVLNVYDLAHSVKSVALPGEAMTIFVVKEGREKDQGIAYLDDGTMVVIEEGRKLIGKKSEVIVSSILQTSSGRMIFTKPKEYFQTNGLTMK